MTYLTKHCSVRAQQRGVFHDGLAAFLALADCSKPIARGLTVLRMSREALKQAIAEGLDPAWAHSFGSLAVIEADDGALVTCAHLHGKKAAAYLRRDRRKFWREA